MEFPVSDDVFFPEPTEPPRTIRRTRQGTIPERVPQPRAARTLRQPSAPSLPRVFPVFQCFICPFFTPSQSVFQEHLKSDLHAAYHKNDGAGRVVLCNGGDCKFCSSSLDKLIDHLERKQFHYVDALTPACMLTKSTYATLTSEELPDGNCHKLPGVSVGSASGPLRSGGDK